MSINGRLFGTRLCEALGIPPKIVSEIRIIVPALGDVKVEIDVAGEALDLQGVVDGIGEAVEMVEIFQDHKTWKTVARLVKEEAL